MTVSVSPASLNMVDGQQQQFTATVVGSLNTDVTWSVSPTGVGSIDANTGIYTAPDPVTAAQSVTVTATSVVDPGTYDSATVNLIIPGSTPTPLSISPNSGSGSGTTFTATFVDSDGSTDINVVLWMFNGAIDEIGACYALYYPSSNLVYLRNDAATSWGTPATAGSATTLTNSTCEIDVSGVTESNSGSFLSVTFPVSFVAPIASTRNNYLYAKDVSGAASGFQNMGTWTIPGTPNQTPTADSVAPSSGSGLTQTFTFSGTDLNGADDIGSLTWVVNTTLSAVGACYGSYNREANAVRLLNDTGTAWGAYVTLGTAGTLANTMCSLDPEAATSSTTGNTLTFTIPVTFDIGSEGAQNIWLLTRDNSGSDSGWQQLGGWEISDTSTTQEVRVDASSDDAEYASGPLTSGDLDLGNHVVGVRFKGLDIPQGATITNAYVQFQADKTSSGTASVTIRGHDTDDAGTFTGASNLISRPQTTASVAWDPSPWTAGQAGAAQQTPDISAVIQEIVDRAGWSSGNDLALILLDDGGERSAESYDGLPGAAPLLHVEYQ